MIQSSEEKIKAWIGMYENAIRLLKDTQKESSKRMSEINFLKAENEALKKKIGHMDSYKVKADRYDSIQKILSLK